jgi:PTS system nitrogen regulatory IIA component
MRLAEYLWQDGIIAELAATEKNAVLSELVTPAVRRNSALDAARVLAVLRDREGLGSTAVGNGIAIPHGKLDDLDRMVLTFGRSGRGIDFNAPDGKPCHLFFMVLAADGAAGRHLGLLGHIARLGRDDTFRTCVMQAKSKTELWDILTAV